MTTQSATGLQPDVAPLVNREFDPADAALTTEDYFVLTRVDGKVTVKQICLISGFPEPKTVAILDRLHREGAILMPGEAPPPRRLKSQRAVAAPPPPERDNPFAEGTVVPRPRPVVIDESLLAEAADLTEDQKRAILAKHAILGRGTYFELLGVGPDADKRDLKRAYFKISKEFHPDRFYGKQLGSYQAKLAEIFKAATDAFEILEDDGRRAAYLARLAGQPAETPRQSGAAPPPGGALARPPVDKAARGRRATELFEQACQHEVMGELEPALREFAAAIQLDPQARYLRRAAEACIRAQELRSAEEYATKAAETDPRDANVHRTLAKVYRAGGRIPDALRELELACRLDPDNAHIAAELDEVRKLSNH